MTLPVADTQYVEAAWVMVVKSLVIFAVIFGILPLMTVLERKLIGRFQHRYGPNRVGPFGILQPLADVGKLLGKEAFRPANAIPTLFVIVTIAFFLMRVAPGGPFDLIWCAGALYFLGVEAGLTAWRNALVPGGWVAFTDAVWRTETPSEEARTNWAEYLEMTDEAGVTAAVERAGYRVAGTRMLPEAAWEAYYGPIDARIAALRAEGPDTELAIVLAEAESEAACWRAHRDEFGYLLVLAQRQ